mgnify:CR=1 FL=1
MVFSLEGLEVPEAWSQVASDVLAQKYFRKAGVNGDPKRGERLTAEAAGVVLDDSKNRGTGETLAL